MHSPANFIGVAGSLLIPNPRSESHRISPSDRSIAFAAPAHDVVSATSEIYTVSEFATDLTQRREFL